MLVVLQLILEQLMLFSDWLIDCIMEVEFGCLLMFGWKLFLYRVFFLKQLQVLEIELWLNSCIGFFVQLLVRFRLFQVFMFCLLLYRWVVEKIVLICCMVRFLIGLFLCMKIVRVLIVIGMVVGLQLYFCLKVCSLMFFILWFIGFRLVVFLVRVGGVVEELVVWIWMFMFGQRCLYFLVYMVIRLVRVLELMFDRLFDILLVF